MGKIPWVKLGRYELSKGTFTKVYHMHNVGTREEATIKILDKDHMSKLGTV
jgi:5'-AMP-activated protein kinase catalytic alpha subunit